MQGFVVSSADLFLQNRKNVAGSKQVSRLIAHARHLHSASHDTNLSYTQRFEDPFRAAPIPAPLHPRDNTSPGPRARPDPRHTLRPERQARIFSIQRKSRRSDRTAMASHDSNADQTDSQFRKSRVPVAFGSWRIPIPDTYPDQDTSGNRTMSSDGAIATGLPKAEPYMYSYWRCCNPRCGATNIETSVYCSCCTHCKCSWCRWIVFQ